MADLIIRSFNAGFWSGDLDGRSDLEKYFAACRQLTNFIPLPFGGAERRPGTVFVAELKDNSKKARLMSFQYSTIQAYVLEYGDQYIRFFRDRGQIQSGEGTEDLSALDNIIAHWLLNETQGTTAADDDGGTHDGTISVNASVITTDGLVGVGSFDLDSQYDITVTDHDDFSFTDNSNDTPFSINCWGHVTDKSTVQNLVSKWRNAASISEWRLSLDGNGKLRLQLSDGSLDLSGDLVSQWKLNETAANTEVHDSQAAGAYPDPNDGVATANASILTAVGLTNMSPCFDFDGQYAVEVADAANLSFDDSGTNPFSIAAWIFVDGDFSQYPKIFAKVDTSPDIREYQFYVTNGRKLSVILYDENASVEIKREADVALTTGWHFVVMTYDSTGGANALDGVTLYVDGSAVASTATNNAAYVAMQAGSAKATIGAYNLAGSLVSFYPDKIDNVMLFGTELTGSQIISLYNDGNGIEDIGEANNIISAVSDAAVALGTHMFTATYSAPADESTAAAGIMLYIDGEVVDSINTENSN